MQRHPPRTACHCCAATAPCLPVHLPDRAAAAAPSPHSISQYRKELEVLGSDIGANRGKMLHLILTLIHKVEKAFEKVVDGGSGGGERILDIFDNKLKESIHRLPFDKILTIRNVRNTINEADGYQPHIIAPEAGYRRLIEDGLSLLRDPAAKAVDLVHTILKSIVTQALASPACRDLARFANLKSEILAHSTVTLGGWSRLQCCLPTGSWQPGRLSSACCLAHRSQLCLQVKPASSYPACRCWQVHCITCSTTLKCHTERSGRLLSLFHMPAHSHACPAAPQTT